ncbi:MAG: phosphoglycerate kinase [Candidatus Fermentibacteraceae bacterium]|nr:phosphoglycerate kinase [Candidatus Fermentibacteraceae bacterium]MBN2607971.1 phosphoglycerate kinase [Candidatus Fermentibacteraceae bacterium]
MRYPSLRDAELAGRRVFLRADLNVPLKNGRVADDTRIRGVVPTIRLLLDRGASVVVASHLGRPGGTRNPELSLAPVADRLEELLEMKVTFAPDCIGARVNTLRASMKPGDVLILENLRFHPEEKEGDEGFARQLAGNADIYVNDAFGTSHRAHASMVGVPGMLGGGYAGLLVQRELEIFDEMLSNPARPFTLVLGGAKVSDKIPVIDNLLPRLDHLLIGGGMAFTFMKEMGLEVGTSLLELDRLGAARKIMDDAGEMGVEVLLPADIVVAPSTDRCDQASTVPADSMPHQETGLDIGPGTVAAFGEVISGSSTVVWNGPMGVFEIPPFDSGTRGLASVMAEATEHGTFTVVGGGDSVRAVTEAGLEKRISFVSTGGGASLKLLQGEELPALAALKGART